MIKPKVLVVEDEAIVAEDIRRTLENLGYAVPSVASSGEKAIQIIKELNPDLVLMDIILQGKMDGVETATQITSLFNIPVIYLTAHSDKMTLERAKITDPFGYIIKPFREKELKMAIEIALFKHETQEQLKESKEWLSTTLKSISDAVVATDPEGCVKFMNPVAQSLTGWKIEEARGIPLKDILNTLNDTESLKDFIATLHDGSAIKDYQTVLISRDKTKISIDISNSPIKDNKGNITGNVMVFRDTTERKKAEETLRESEERYRRLVDFSPFGIGIHSESKFVYVNLAGMRIFGAAKPEEIIGKPVLQFIHPDYREIVKERIRIEEQGEIAPLIEEKILRVDGTSVDVELTSIPLTYKGKQAIYEVFQDVTERKRAVEALRLKEERFRLLIENASDIITILNVDGTISYESPSVERVLGYRPEELIGRTLSEFVHPDNLSDVTNTINNIVQNPGTARSAEFRCRHKDGSWCIIEFVGKSVLNDTGANELIVNSRDITKRKLAEEEILRRSQIQASLNKLLQISLQNTSLEEILEQVIEHITSIPWLAFESMGGIWLVDEDSNTLVMKAQRRLPSPLRTVCARIPFGRCLCSRAASSEKIVFADKIDEHHENRYHGIAPHGHYCVPLISSGRIIGVINLFLKEGHRRNEKEEEFLNATADVLVGMIQRKQVEEALKRSGEFSRTILDSMNDALCIIDANDFRIMGANRVFLRELGLSEEDVTGRTCYYTTHHRSDPCKPPDDTCPLLETVKTGKHSIVEHLHYGKDGKKIYVEVSTSPILDEKGRITQVVHLSRDVTERKLAEERLKEANIELIRANKLKTQFLSVVSHELRTPITPMNAQLQMILAGFFGEITEKQKNSLDMILRNTKRLDRLIGDVLDISKLESGVMKFNMAKACLNEIVENAVETMRIQALDKNQELTIKEDTIPEITVDKDRITQVVVNLLNNAIKFTDAGGKIEVELSGNADHARVEVRDNGIGIKKEDQERLFTPFQQADSSESRKYEGSGLGLAICKKIITYHGGCVGIDSEPGRGSTFYFTIPYNYQIKKENVDSSLFEKIMQNEA